MIFDLLEEAGVSDVPASIEIIARVSDRLGGRRMNSASYYSHQQESRAATGVLMAGVRDSWKSKKLSPIAKPPA
jgi:hypothetical protein